MLAVPSECAFGSSGLASMTGLASLQAPSPVHTLELPAQHGYLATPSPNCTVKERQVRHIRSQPCPEHHQRQLTKHEWPLSVSSSSS